MRTGRRHLRGLRSERDQAANDSDCTGTASCGAAPRRRPLTSWVHRGSCRPERLAGSATSSIRTTCICNSRRPAVDRFNARESRRSHAFAAMTTALGLIPASGRHHRLRRFARRQGTRCRRPGHGVRARHGRGRTYAAPARACHSAQTTASKRSGGPKSLVETSAPVSPKVFAALREAGRPHVTHEHVTAPASSPVVDAAARKGASRAHRRGHRRRLRSVALGGAAPRTPFVTTSPAATPGKPARHGGTLRRRPRSASCRGGRAPRTRLHRNLRQQVSGGPAIHRRGGVQPRLAGSDRDRRSRRSRSARRRRSSPRSRRSPTACRGRSR